MTEIIPIEVIIICTTFSSIVSSIFFIELLKSNGYWITPPPATESDVFRVVHSILYDSEIKMEETIKKSTKDINNIQMHRYLQLKDKIKDIRLEIENLKDE